MRVLLSTDSFPPVCGGSGWSTFELARGLRAAGHEVVVVQPRPGAPTGSADRRYDGLRVREVGVAAPNVPYLRNYFKSERLTRIVAPAIASIVAREGIDIVHGQHVMSALPAAVAARDTGRPFICTVRDYWPVCYWSTLLVSPTTDDLCETCTPTNMRRCTRARAGAAWPLALPLLPYMRANLRRKADALLRADAVIAVSTVIARDIDARCPGLTAKLHTIPNPVDVADLRARADAMPAPRQGAYALYVGKLAPNKGVRKLFDAAERASLAIPLVVVGDGPDRTDLERRAAASSIPTTFTGWLSRDETLAWMAHASFLIFPSQGPESLSRVLLESSALGVPAAAMHTGGTADIVLADHTGLLSATVDDLARDIARLAARPEERARLGAAAASHVANTFDAPHVVRRVVGVYEATRERQTGAGTARSGPYPPDRTTGRGDHG